MVKMADIAHIAGVSVMTVSRVISGSGYVKDSTRKKVLRAMKDLNFVPKGLTKNAIHSETSTLALIVPDITNPFFTFVARGMEDVARKNGYRVFIANTDETLHKEADYIEMCVSLHVDGVLIAPVGDTSSDNLGLLQKSDIPFVLIDREIPGIEADIVKADIVSASLLLVTHLIELGHRKIAAITGPLINDASRERLQGYALALAEHQIPYREEWVKESTMTRNTDLRFLNELLQLEDAPTAWFVANLFQYANVVTALKEKGIRVPEDLSLVCFGNSDALAGVDSHATCAIQPTYNFGSLGTQLLMERMEGNQDPPRTIVLQPSVILRESTAPPKV